ncbi:MAG: hypothetical protein P1V97_05345, partial [Planctomycetota bacterium]|nr:hypothetical protein [Planctomycetota bacterium]
IGYTMDAKLIDDVGAVKLSRGSEWTYQLNTNTMQTSVPNVFIAGSAAAGQQSAIRLFVENSHSHVLRIIRQLTGANPRFINPLAYEQFDSSAQRINDIQASFQSPKQALSQADTELETEYQFNPGIQED